MLAKASKNGYAIPAYNINNLEWAKYILEACNEDKSPVILSATENAIDYMGGNRIVVHTGSWGEGNTPVQHQHRESREVFLCHQTAVGFVRLPETERRWSVTEVSFYPAPALYRRRSRWGCISYRPGRMRMPWDPRRYSHGLQRLHEVRRWEKNMHRVLLLPAPFRKMPG